MKNDCDGDIDGDNIDDDDDDDDDGDDGDDDKDEDDDYMSQSECQCRDGYEELTPDACTLISACKTNPCHAKANCTTTGPSQYR